MSTRLKIIVTLVLLLLLGGLGAADYFLSGDEYAAKLIENPDASSASSSESYIPTVGTQKQSGPDVLNVITAAGYTTQKSEELSFLAQIAGSGASVSSAIILKNDDRAGSVTWTDSRNVKNQFIALKEALLGAFSSRVSDLRDETKVETDSPVRNILSFSDPALSEERLVFVRVRERLYEFHLAKGKEDMMIGLIEEITTK